MKVNNPNYLNGLSSSASEIDGSVKKTNFFVTPEIFGVINGVNDSNIINLCLSNINSDIVFFEPKTYMIDPQIPIKLRSNQTIVLSEKTKFKALLSPLGTYSIVTLEDIENTTILGTLHVDGEKDIHTGTTGEWGMGVSIFNSCKNIFIDNIVAKNCWGDGVYISSDNGVLGVENLHIKYIESYNNRRQGVSIVSGNNINIGYIKTYGIIGAAPEAGVDIEPNETILTNVRIGVIETFNNAGSGLTFERFYTNSFMKTIWIGTLISHNNSKHGISANKVVDFTIDNANIYENQEDGIIMGRDNIDWKIRNVKSNKNGGRGLSCVPSLQTALTGSIIFENCDFSNNAQIVTTADGAKVDATNGIVKNVKFKNCKFYDDQANHTQRYGFTCSTNIDGMSFDEDCKFYGNKMEDYIIDSKYERLFIGVQTKQSGITTSRPTSPKRGEEYYDTTLNKPIWWSGTYWRDASGVVV